LSSSSTIPTSEILSIQIFGIINFCSVSFELDAVEAPAQIPLSFPSVCDEFVSF
jgi:hypothetical protein